MRAYTPDPDVTMIKAGDVDFACLQWGDEDAPLVLMVHGFPDTARSWDLAGPRVAAEGFRVVAPYTRGHAPTSIPADGRYDSDTLGGDIVALIDALGYEQAIVIAHDWGASAAYSAVGLYPERISKLVTLAIPHPASIKPNLSLLWGTRHFIAFKLPGAARRFSKRDFAGIREMYERWSPGFDWPEEEFEHAKNCFSAPGSLDASLGYYRALTPKPPPGHRKRVKVPTLVLGGLTDGVMNEAGFQASRSRFTGEVEVKMLPGGHFLHREHPEAFLDAVIPFLKS